MKKYQIKTGMLDEIMLGLGFRENLLGTQYLREAVALYASGYVRITKEVYPEVAKLCGTIPTRVERAIRHSIETALMFCDPDYIKEIFGGTISPNKGKPTNSEFIARLARLCREEELELGEN
jgi:two-component system response regulator (stage 0 sporulation protein A)